MSTTNVHFYRRNFMVNGDPVNMGHRAQGRPMNFRAVMAAVHDYSGNLDTLWAYPDGPWDKDRNTNEFIAQFDNYRAKGLNLVTIGLMGGHPCYRDCGFTCGSRDIGIYTGAGALRADFKTRVESIISAADDVGLLVNVQLFYQNPTATGQLDSAQAYLTGLDNAVNWLKGLNMGNILIEVCNECRDSNYPLNTESSPLNPANMADRLDRIEQLWPAVLKTVSMSSTVDFPADITSRIDWISFHANGLTTSEMRNKINTWCGRSSMSGKPIVCTEDGPATTTDLYAAVDEGAGWGFYEECKIGYQTPWVDWRTGHSTKTTAFFNAVADVTGN